MIENRPDCEDFKPKRFGGDCGDCQTDGHYLCVGCRHIAPFEDMELYDNMLRYYPKDARIKALEEELDRRTGFLKEHYLCLRAQQDVSNEIKPDSEKHEKEWEEWAKKNLVDIK